MAKELYLNKENKVVKVDDLSFDGKQLNIPSYWTSTILDIVNGKSTEDDVEDFNTFKEFLSKVEDYIEEQNNSGN